MRSYYNNDLKFKVHLPREVICVHVREKSSKLVIDISMENIGYLKLYYKVMSNRRGHFLRLNISHDLFMFKIQQNYKKRKNHSQCWDCSFPRQFFKKKKNRINKGTISWYWVLPKVQHMSLLYNLYALCIYVYIYFS